MKAVSLCALIWAGSAHAGFIGTDVNVELQRTISGALSTSSTSVSVTGSLTNISLDGVGITINESLTNANAATIDLTTPLVLAGDDIALTISYSSTVDQITDASIMGDAATLGVFGADFIPLTNLIAMSNATVDLTFGPLSSTESNLLVSDALIQIQQDPTTHDVPEPMSLDLMALGLVILGMMMHQRRHARV